MFWFGRWWLVVATVQSLIYHRWKNRGRWFTTSWWLRFCGLMAADGGFKDPILRPGGPPVPWSFRDGCWILLNGNGGNDPFLLPIRTIRKSSHGLIYISFIPTKLRNPCPLPRSISCCWGRLQVPTRKLAEVKSMVVAVFFVPVFSQIHWLHQTSSNSGFPNSVSKLWSTNLCVIYTNSVSKLFLVMIVMQPIDLMMISVWDSGQKDQLLRNPPKKCVFLLHLEVVKALKLAIWPNAMVSRYCGNSHCRGERWAVCPKWNAL